MKKSTAGKNSRILGRRLAKEVSRKDLAGASAGIALPEVGPSPIGGIETTTLIVPPDRDNLGGGIPV